MSEIEEILNTMNQLEEHLILIHQLMTQILQSLQTETDQPTLDFFECIEILDSEKQAELCLLMTYAINALSFIYLKLENVQNVENVIGLDKELLRVKSYMRKFKYLKKASFGDRKNQLDVEASQRMIQNSLPIEKQKEIEREAQAFLNNVLSDWQ